LHFRAKRAIAYELRFLATPEAVTEAAERLREKLASEEVHRNTAYVSRWNAEAKSVEFVVGKFYEDSDYDPDDEVPEQNGPWDLRPFRLVREKRLVQLQYCCDHVLDGWVLLLEGQPDPPPEVVYKTALPCLACIGKYTNQREAIGVGVPSHPPELQRTELWEKSSQFDWYVTPAFEHPKDIEHAASLFYTAYPDRKHWHPQSLEFRAQISGWSDEDIEQFSQRNPEYLPF
jgi:hypothetical protein